MTMKSLFAGALSLLTITSTLAAPTSETGLNAPVSEVEERTFFNLWKPGYKPYKYKIYCPAKPCHDKYLCEKPGKDDEPSHLGYTSPTQTDFQFYLSEGSSPTTYKYTDYTDPTRTVSLAGPPDYHHICPIKEPPTHHFPSGWTCQYDKWWISPVYDKFQQWRAITLEFFKVVRYWELNEDGWKWVVHGDGKGGWDVKVCGSTHSFPVSPPTPF
ncbi:MAG: hypothetical protein Q9182_003802 [Xanthomendoza sp. 2 TL-2023]